MSDEHSVAIRKVPHSGGAKKSWLPVTKLLKSLPVVAQSEPRVKYTAVSGIKLQENPRQIILPPDFDGRVQIDVGSNIFQLGKIYFFRFVEVASSATVGYYGARLTGCQSSGSTSPKPGSDDIFIDTRHAVQVIFAEPF